MAERSRQQVEAIARQTLEEHGLFSVPVDPVAVAARLGLEVFNAKFSEESLAALLSRRGDKAVVLINESDAPYRKRFSIGHELGHHLLHLQGDGEMVDREADMFRTQMPADPAAGRAVWRQEVEANQFAAALLMPAELVTTAWASERSIVELARRFNVSEEAMGIRVNTLELA